MNIYYKIWVDTLNKIKSKPQNQGTWKLLSFTFITMAMCLNVIVIQWCLGDLGLINQIFQFKINIFPGSRLDALMSFIVTFVLPISLINYFLILHKKKYVKLMDKYDGKEGKLFLSYFLGSLALVLLYFIGAFLAVRIY